MAYLDGTGLTHFWNKLKQTFLPLSGGAMTGYLAVPGLSLAGSNVADFVTEINYASADNTWSYRKWFNGAAECWGRFPATYANANVLLCYLGFPFSFTWVSSAMATINNDGNNEESAWRWNVKAVSGPESVNVYIHDSGGGFGSDNGINVSVHILGRWK